MLRKKKNKGYQEVQIASGDKEESKDKRKEEKSKLPPKLQKLMGMIFDRKSIENTLREMGYDA